MNKIIPKINHRHVFSLCGKTKSPQSDSDKSVCLSFYPVGTLSLPKKTFPPKKPVKKEVLSQDTSEGVVKTEIETLKTEVQLATLSQSIGSKEFSIGGETVNKKVYDMYNQFKRDRMTKQHEIGELGPKTVTQKYQNLSWEYFKTNILNKDEKYSVM